jgi:mono/diheme cytochrome c family protein
MKNLGKFTLVLGLAVATFSCSEGEKKQEKTAAAVEESPAYGFGPFKDVKLADEINQELAATGQKAFESKCVACHSFDKRMIGPSLGGISKERNAGWILNMIINPIEMTQKDPIAKALLKEYGAQMVPMGVNPDEAKAILEYMRSKDSETM